MLTSRSMTRVNGPEYLQAMQEVPDTIFENDKIRDGVQFLVSAIALYLCANIGIERSMGVLPLIAAATLVVSHIMDARSTVQNIEAAEHAEELGIVHSAHEAGMFMMEDPTTADITRGRGLLIDTVKIAALVGAPIIGPLGVAGPIAGIGHSVGKVFAALNNKVMLKRMNRAIEIRETSLAS